MWLLRWLVILVLFLQSLWMLSAFGLPIALLLEGDMVGPQLEAISLNFGGTSILEITLTVVTLVAFLLAIVRLIRRTQGWFYWLLGFVFLVARRAVHGIAPQLAASPPSEMARQVVENLHASETWMFNAGLLGVNLLIGLAIIVVDVADKRFWAAERARAV